MNRLNLLIPIICFVFASCGGGNQENTNNETAPLAAGGEEPTTQVVEEGVLPQDNTPCSLLNAQLIVDVFGKPDTPITSDAVNRAIPFCKLSWVAKEPLKTDIGATVVTTEQNNNIMLIIPPNEATAERFERSTSVYKDAEAVEGIGERAVWSSKQHQITFMKGKKLLHLNVEYHDGDPKEKAIELAKLVADKIN